MFDSQTVLVPAAQAAARSIAPEIRFSRASVRERSSQKRTGLFFGDTDGGKTTECMAFGLGPHSPEWRFGTLLQPPAFEPSQVGRILCLSFDNKSKQVKAGSFGDTKNIWVVDAAQYYRDTGNELQTWSAKVTIDFVGWAIDSVSRDFLPHSVMIDGFDRENEISKMGMRYQHGLGTTQGFKERQWWQDRRSILRSIHRKAEKFCQCWVLYTCYYASAFADEGADTVRDKTPGWVDVLYTASDFAVDCRSYYSAALKAKEYERYVLKAKPDLGELLSVGSTASSSGRKTFPWGPAHTEIFARAQKALGGRLPTAWPEDSADPSDIPPPLPAYQSPPPELPTKGEVPVGAAASASAPSYSAPPVAPPPSAPVIPRTVAGVDLTAPPPKRTSADEM